MPAATIPQRTERPVLRRDLLRRRATASTARCTPTTPSRSADNPTFGRSPSRPDRGQRRRPRAGTRPKKSPTPGRAAAAARNFDGTFTDQLAGRSRRRRPTAQLKNIAEPKFNFRPGADLPQRDHDDGRQRRQNLHRRRPYSGPIPANGVVYVESDVLPDRLLAVHRHLPGHLGLRQRLHPRQLLRPADGRDRKRHHHRRQPDPQRRRRARPDRQQLRPHLPPVLERPISTQTTHERNATSGSNGPGSIANLRSTPRSWRSTTPSSSTTTTAAPAWAP